MMLWGPQGTQRVKFNYYLRAVIITLLHVLFKAWQGSDQLCDYPVGGNRTALVSLSSKNPRPTAGRGKLWLFLHCLEVLASLASAPAVSWDILGWGTLSVPWDLFSMLNTIFKLSIHSITWLNLCPYLQPLPAAVTGAIHTQFCGSKETTKAKISFFQQKFPLTGSPAINSGTKKAWEPAVTMLL